MSPLELPTSLYPPEGSIVIITTLEGERAAYRFRGSWYVNDDEVYVIGQSTLRLDDEEVIAWKPL